MTSMLPRSSCAQSLSFAGELLSTPDLWHQVHISSEREGTKKAFKHVFWYHNSRRSVTSCIFPSWLIFNHTSVDSPTQTRRRSDGLRRTALQSYLLTGQFGRKFPRSFQEFGMKVYPPRHLCEETGHLLGSIQRTGRLSGTGHAVQAQVKQSKCQRWPAASCRAEGGNEQSFPKLPTQHGEHLMTQVEIPCTAVSFSWLRVKLRQQERC